MKNLKTIFQFLIISFVIMSCESENLSNEEDSREMNAFREAFIKNLDGTEEKTAFANLSEDQKKGIWKSKIEHIISTDVSTTQRDILLKMIHSLDNNTSSESLKYSEEFRGLILEFANTTDYENFTNMFLTLNSFSNYNIVHKNGLGREYLIKKIKSDFEGTKRYKVEGNEDTEGKPNCNCDWTCDEDSPFYLGDGDCEVGGHCGFLFLFDCNEYH